MGDRVRFFISHAGADRAWAEWVAWQLEEAGYAVELDVWDWAAGQNLLTAMSDALDRCDRVVALFSSAYFERERYTTQEWAAALNLHGSGQDCLIPLRIEDVPVKAVPAVLRQLVFGDLFGRDEAQARQVLLDAVAGRGGRITVRCSLGSGTWGAWSGPVERRRGCRGACRATPADVLKANSQRHYSVFTTMRRARMRLHCEQ